MTCATSSPSPLLANTVPKLKQLQCYQRESHSDRPNGIFSSRKNATASPPPLIIPFLNISSFLDIQRLPKERRSIINSTKDGVIADSHDCKACGLIIYLQPLKDGVVIAEDVTKGIIVFEQARGTRFAGISQ